MYEQLQEFLNECIRLGYIPRGFGEGKDIITYPYCIEYDYSKYSYHELFSKENGIMEFVEWEKDENIEKIIIQEHGGFKYDVKWSPYYAMSDMTAEEKIQYFLSNATIGLKNQL